MLAFKRHPSLRNKLVKAKLPTTEDNDDNIQETTKQSPDTLSKICGTSTQLKNPNIPIYTGKQLPTFQRSWIRRLATRQPLGMKFILIDSLGLPSHGYVQNRPQRPLPPLEWNPDSTMTTPDGPPEERTPTYRNLGKFRC